MALGNYLMVHGNKIAGEHLVTTGKHGGTAEVALMAGEKGIPHAEVKQIDLASQTRKSVVDTQNIGKYGESVNLGNAVDGYINSKESVKQLTQELLKPNMIGFMRTNNENTFIAGATALFDKVLPLVNTKYAGKTAADTSNVHQKIDEFFSNLSFGSLKGGLGGSLGISHTNQSIKRDSSSRGSNYDSMFDTLRNNFRKEAMQIYNKTKNIENPIERSNKRANMIASSIMKEIGSATLNQRSGYSGIASTDVSVPVLSQDNSGKPLPTYSPEQAYIDKSEILKQRTEYNEKWQQKTRFNPQRQDQDDDINPPSGFDKR